MAKLKTALAIVILLSTCFVVRSMIEQRKYGKPISLDVTDADVANGSRETGIPFWIWVSLPRVYPKHLPTIGDYAALGLKWENGNQMPIGLVKVNDGVDRVVIDSTVNTPNLSLYKEFIRKCITDNNLDSEAILNEITYNVPLSQKKKRIYKKCLIPAMRNMIRQ